MHLLAVCFRWLPNLITIGRLFLVPAIVAMIASQRWGAACMIFIVAGLSDALDGWIAKTFDLRTGLGAFLDPLADKALLVSIYVALALLGAVPAIVAGLVVARDVMIASAIGVSWLLGRPVAIQPILISKLNTAAQITVAAMILAMKAFAVPAGAWANTGFYIVAALTLLSLAAYLHRWLRHLSP